MDPKDTDRLVRSSLTHISTALAVVVCVIFFSDFFGLRPLLISILSLASLVAARAWIGRKLEAVIKDAREAVYSSISQLNTELQQLDTSGSPPPIPLSDAPEPVKDLTLTINSVLNRLTFSKVSSDAIFDQMGQGFLTCDKNMKILNHYSRYLTKIFGEDSPEGKDVCDYLFGRSDVPQDNIRQMKFHIRSLFGMSKLQWMVSSMNFVREATITLAKRKIDVRYHYFPSYNERGEVSGISIVVEDISQYNQAKKQADHRQKEMEKIFSLLQVSDALFQTFMEETYHLFDQLKEDAKLLTSCDQTNYHGSIERMFRHIHTLKGNSRLFKLSSIQNVAHDIETFLSNLRDGSLPFDQEALLNLRGKLMEINQELYSYTSLRREILGGSERANNLTITYRIQWIKSLISQYAAALRDPRIGIGEIDRIQKELHRVLSSFDKISLTEYINRYDSMIQDYSQKCGKRILPIVRRLESRYFDSHTVARINDILGHLIRNSIAHGIETKEGRTKAGKAVDGTIAIHTSDCDGLVSILVSDDGAGLDRVPILEKAIEMRLVLPEEASTLSDLAVYDFIFHPGFSVEQSVTDISGRGVGMAAVKAIVAEMNGTIEVSSKPNEGTCISISFCEQKEHLITSNAVFDIRSSFENSFNDLHKFFQIGRVRADFKCELGEKRYYAMGDSLTVNEILKNICLELFDIVPPETSVTCTLVSKKGMRHIDSHEYFRFKFTCDALASQFRRPMTAESPGLKRAAELVRKSNGSLRIVDSNTVELNIPSNMPVAFSHYSFAVNILMEQGELVAPLVNDYFETIMNGWKHSVALGLSKVVTTKATQNEIQVFIIAEDCMKEYEKFRPSERRFNDRVIIVSASRDGLDEPDTFSLLPNSAVYVPGPIQRGNLANALEAIVLKCFAQGSSAIAPPIPEELPKAG